MVETGFIWKLMLGLFLVRGRSLQGRRCLHLIPHSRAERQGEGGEKREGQEQVRKNM